MIEAESRDVGGIKWSDYLEFVNFSSGNCGILMLFLVSLLQALA